MFNVLCICKLFFRNNTAFLLEKGKGLASRTVPNSFYYENGFYGRLGSKLYNDLCTRFVVKGGSLVFRGKKFGLLMSGSQI